MKKSDSHSSADAALRNVAAARTLQARRVLHAAKKSLDNVAKANNVQLINSSRTTPAAEEDS
jgi:hypothetical protein